MYRPEGLENPYPTYDSDKELGNTCGFDCEYHAFERGIDAVLEALKKSGSLGSFSIDYDTGNKWSVKDYGDDSYWNDFADVLPGNTYGYLVFIPE